MAIGMFIVDECYMMREELEKQIGDFKKDQAVRIIVIDSCGMLHDFSTLEERVLWYGKDFQVAPVRELDEWDIRDSFGDWRDFIKNPTRPKQKGRAYKAPRQSFKAQMRSVNRNR